MVSVAFAVSSGPSPRVVQEAPSQRPGPAALEWPEPTEIVLRVSGAKPLRMRAQTLAEGTSWCYGTPAWHEVTLYQRDTGEFPVAVKTFKKASSEPDVFQAEQFATLDEAILWLETFDPTGELSTDIDVSDRRTSTVDITLKAAALRQRADQVARQYRSLIGEMLFQLDAQP